jgi:hypothetical protein
MTHILIKMTSRDIVFGKLISQNSEEIVIEKPHEFFYKDNEVTIAPYDAMSVQGTMNEVTFSRKEILYFTDLADMKHILEAYNQAVTGILIPNKQIIT